MSAEWLEAADDDGAREEARTRSDSGQFELWDKNRLVERYRPDAPQA